MTNTINKTLLYGAIVLAILALMYLLVTPVYRTEASVSVTNEYNATTTAVSNMYGATVSSSRMIKPGYGSLGSVIITGATAGIFNLYDATTSDVTKRTNNLATSTLLIASFPASVAAGTYTFDVVFVNGLFVDIQSATVATSTITFR